MRRSISLSIFWILIAFLLPKLHVLIQVYKKGFSEEQRRSANGMIPIPDTSLSALQRQENSLVPLRLASSEFDCLFAPQVACFDTSL